MKLIEMKCKNCGATLKVNPDDKNVNCTFCNTVFKIDDEVQHVKYDDMEQSGYEFEKGKIRAREEANQKKIMNQNAILQAQYDEERRKKNLKWWIIGWIFFFPIPLTILIWKSKWDKNKKIIATIILWGGLLIYGALNPSDTETSQTNLNESTNMKYTLIGGTLGQYGKKVTLNKDTDAPVTKYLYKIPTGTYTVTTTYKNLSEFWIVKDNVVNNGTDKYPEELIYVGNAHDITDGDDDFNGRASKELTITISSDESVLINGTETLIFVAK